MVRLRTSPVPSIPSISPLAAQSALELNQLLAALDRELDAIFDRYDDVILGPLCQAAPEGGGP